MSWERFIEAVDKGKSGDNSGLPFGITHFDNFCYSVQPSTYYLLGGETSTGKTALVDTMFVLNPLMYLINRKERILNGEKLENENLDYLIFYYSFEISELEKIAKWVCFLVWRKFHVIIDFNYLLSKGKNRISDEVYKYTLECKFFVEHILNQYIYFVENPLNPTGILYQIKDKLKQLGTYERVKIKIKDQETEELIYKPNNPNLIFLFIVDHLGLVKSEEQLNKKILIDRLSQYAISLRNLEGVSPVFVSQFNRELADVNRQRFKVLQPQLSDFKDTGNPAEDCNICIATFNPLRYNIQSYMDYDMVRFGRRTRFAFLLKNRYGIADVGFALNFLGESGYFRDMPLVKDLNINNKLAEKVMNFDKY